MQSEIEYIADHYGINNQLLKLVEEMSEVSKEIMKLLTAKEDKVILDIYRNTLPEELADLSVVYDQIVYLMGCEEQIEEWRLTKSLFWDICHSQNVPSWYADTVKWDRLADGVVYTKLMINLLS